ncbi:MAG: HupE/UreJ family protein [Bacteroidota bacterium]
MSAFGVYFQFGFGHITDLAAYDHLLFLVTLCAVYPLKAWRQIVVLVTAFTIGHSLTLALVALDVFRLPAPLIEVLIPITILVTAIYNVGFAHAQPTRVFSRVMLGHYSITFLFGLIHGMGFSNHFRSLVRSTNELIQTLLAFNLGVEVGQLCIVGVYLLILFLATKLTDVKQSAWNLFLSGAGAGVAFVMLLERLVDLF